MREFMHSVAARWHSVAASARDESGQALIEYALIASLISVIAIGALTATGTSVNTLLTAVANAV